MNANDVKTMAKSLGADLCGIASMDRFEGAPKQQDPRYIFPAAKSAIVLGFRIPRGYFRGIEEGTYFAAYSGMGYGALTAIYMPMVMRELCCYIEDNGYEAAPVPNMYLGSSILFKTQQDEPNRSRSVDGEKPHPDILVDFRVMAFAAGLGEFGWSKMFLTPEFGPRQRLVAILSDAPLDPDPLFDGKICDRCKRCVSECSGNAISATETEGITIAGRRVEWGKFDAIKCSIAYRGGNPEYNPFMHSDAKPEEFQGKYAGNPELDKVLGYSGFNSSAVVEGARGCIRACMIHLEDKGVLKNKFENKFRTTPPWRIKPREDDNTGKCTKEYWE